MHCIGNSDIKQHSWLSPIKLKLHIFLIFDEFHKIEKNPDFWQALDAQKYFLTNFSGRWAQSFLIKLFDIIALKSLLHKLAQVIVRFYIYFRHF
jgi:hypothetical protein